MNFFAPVTLHCAQLYDHENLVLAFKEHKKSVMVWGCFYGDTLGPLEYMYFPAGSINSDGYMNLLEKTLLPLIDEEDGLIENLLGSRNLTLQQDNAPIHTSRKTTRFMQQNGIRTISWPANSPGLNPNEHLWHLLKRLTWRTWARQRNALNKTVTTEDFETLVKEAWVSTDPAHLRSLVESMPRRIEAVISAKGGHTKY